MAATLDQAKFQGLFRKPEKSEHRRIIRAVDVRKTYRMGAQETHALRGATLDIFEGEYLSIMGPSGSGKSTLFNMIGGLGKPTSGKVYIDQVDIAQLDHNELAWLRCRKIGYIFQSYNLIQVMTCLENVMLPMSFAGLTSEEARDKGIAILKLVGLGHRILHKPGELSGGQQQRCAIARSLANSPEIVLADEPTANLDMRTGEEMIELLAKLKMELGVTIISATHDLKMLKRSDRILWIADGRIVKMGRPDEIDFTARSSTEVRIVAWYRRKPKPVARLSGQHENPLAVVPGIEPGVEAREDAQKRVQLRRVLPPKPGLYAWFSRVFHYDHAIRLDLDAVGSFFWNQIDGCRTLRQIAQAVAREFGFDENHSREAVVKFVGELMRRRMIYLAVGNGEQRK